MMEAIIIMLSIIIVLCSDLWGQDMVQYSSKYGWYYNDYKFDQTSRAYQYISVYYFWNYLYKLIKSANDVLKTTVDDSKKEERGQALGMRAFAYLTLVQMYQHTYSGHENDPAVPIVLETTEPDVLSNNPRASVQAVYDQIEKDLLQAHGDLAEFQRLNITYINQSVISGLLARMYLLKEDWFNAYRPDTHSRFLTKRQNISIISRSVRRPQSPQSLALLQCTTSQREAFSELSGNWGSVPASDWKLI